MLIVINILVVVYLLAMIYWWGAQGAFSALLHLVATLAAAAIAFAIWEPVAYALMFQPSFAWGVGLLAPFGLLLLGFRYALDKLIPGNMKFAPILDFAAGGAMGFVAAIVGAGMVILGGSMLPLSTVWYQPLVLTEDARVLEGDGLWVPVNRWTSNLYQGLSVGAFSSNRPLAYYNPDLATQVNLVRLGFDDNASFVAVPGSVTIDTVYTEPTPVAELSPAVATGLGDGFNRDSNKLVVVDTTWEPVTGTFDPVDNTARIPPGQVRLVTVTSTGSRIDSVQLHAPAAVSQEVTGGDERVFRPFSTDRVFAFATREENLGWSFVVPEDQEPRFLLVRNTRLMLPGVDRFNSDVDALKQVLGLPASDQNGGDSNATTTASGRGDDAEKGTVDAGDSGMEIEITNALPADISKNTVSNLNYDDTDPQLILSGNDLAERPDTRMGQRTRATGIYTPSHMTMIRVRVDRTKAQSLLGTGRASASRRQAITVEGESGTTWAPTAYVMRESSQDQLISVGERIESAEQLPISQMTPDSSLYLYFMVNRGVTVTKLNIGDESFPINVQTR